MVLPGPEVYEGIEAMGLPDDLQGWNSDHPAFQYFVERAAGPGESEPMNIIEVGSWKGASAVTMLRLAPSTARIYCVDTWLGGVDHILSDKPQDQIPKRNGYPQLYFQFLHNIRKAGFADRVVAMPMTSVTGARVLRAQEVRARLVYVDGSHEYPDVWADLQAYWPLVSPGGTMFGDDWGALGVQAAVLRFAEQERLQLHLTDKNFWSFVKP